MSTVVLRPWPWDAARALLAGRPVRANDWHEEYPTPDTVDALAMVLAAYEVDGPLTGAPPWWVFQVRDAGQVVGDAGFHGPPAADGPVEVEIGYGVVPAVRGRGIATAACGQLLELAWHLGADTVLAGADADNLASRRVLQRAGFGERPDGMFTIGRPG
ncbi:GNAT family N-acetyltransferase [uncultured Friedmanniella sp.]|uniref:GNAT family N-acetyltransferase n=1 Tax=uncultured Friedmanniella sp. TaxID=335381 RepID=UPI0035C98CA8